jgi:biopolymer transport protein ExbB
LQADFSTKDSPVFEIVKAAGWPIWPLLLASVISVALIIERLVALRHSKVVPAGLLQRAVGEFKRGANNDKLLEELERHSPSVACCRPACATSMPRARS